MSNVFLICKFNGGEAHMYGNVCVGDLGFYVGHGLCLRLVTTSLVWCLGWRSIAPFFRRAIFLLAPRSYPFKSSDFPPQRRHASPHAVRLQAHPCIETSSKRVRPLGCCVLPPLLSVFRIVRVYRTSGLFANCYIAS